LFRLALACGSGFGRQKIKVIPRFFEINRQFPRRKAAVRADFFEKERISQMATRHARFVRA